MTPDEPTLREAINDFLCKRQTVDKPTFARMEELLDAAQQDLEDLEAYRKKYGAARPFPRKPDPLTDDISAFLESANPEFSQATELLMEARDSLRLVEAERAALAHKIETEAATYLTISQLLREYPTAREWFQSMVIDTIKPGDQWAYRNKSQFEWMLELAEKHNPAPAPEHADKPANWGQF